MDGDGDKIGGGERETREGSERETNRNGEIGERKK